MNNSRRPNSRDDKGRNRFKSNSEDKTYSKSKDNRKYSKSKEERISKEKKTGYKPKDDRPSNDRFKADKPKSDRPKFNDEREHSGERKTNNKYSKHPNFRREPSAKKKLEAKKNDYKNDVPIRLNRYVANSGVCSRREADEYIKAGLVKVNGKVIAEMGVKVEPSDQVTFNDKILNPENLVYILLNKPKGYVTTTKDAHADKTVMDLISDACDERVYPVGRLDKMTTGVLLLTNDGDLTKKLTHPSRNKKKIYHVHLDKVISKNELTSIVDGIEVKGLGKIHADAISYPDPDDKKQVGIEIHSGQNRIIRRIFEELEYTVVRLDRVYFAGLTKKSITRGKWRYLKEKEINQLKMGAFV